jgi:hypothetical protein
MSATETRPGWTAAVYLAGGENVTREMIPGLHDLRDVCLSNRDALSTLAQFEPGGKAPRLLVFDDSLLPKLSLPRKPRALAATPVGLANYEHLIELPAEELGRSFTLLKRFFDTAKAAAGERALLVVISGHASGAVGELLGFRPERDPLQVPDLARALTDRDEPGGRRIDILGMDCCCMSMVEIAYELAPHAKFLVASQGTVLNHGWPYREILEAVVGLTPREAAAEIARQYVGTYSDYSLLDVEADCAVTDLDELPQLTAPMRRLTERLIAGIEDPDVWRPAVLAHWEAQSYKDEQYTDLADFCERLRVHAGDAETRERCMEVIDAVSRIVGTTCSSGSGSQYSTGLSVYFPWCNDAVKAKGANGRSELEAYQELTFSRETSWGAFLDAYLSATRRAPRRAAESGNISFESVPVQSVNEETTMAIKNQGNPMKIRPKNDRRPEAPVEASIPVRLIPPMHGRGTAGETQSVKNHPRERK